MEQKIKLSDHFGYKRLLRFTVPSILMMIITSIYGVVDGFFISNFVGKTPFAAVNFIMPFLMVVGVLGFMFGAGGSALVAKTMGEGEEDKARKIFSMLIYSTIISGIIIAVLCIIFIRPIAVFLGADSSMLENCVVYGRIILAALPFLMLQYAFSTLLVTAEKPKLGLYVTIIAGITNVIGDAVFIALLDMGVVGAALATAAGQVVGGIIPLIYFAFRKQGTLRLGKPYFNFGLLLKVCANGSSELMSNISMSVVGMLYNAQLMKYAGENGVAAYGTIMYVNFSFLAVFIGYSMGVAPVISYHFGAKNSGEVKSILKKSLSIILSSSTVMFVLSEVMANSIANIFVGYDKELFEMTVRAFKIYSVSFMFAGFAIFGSSFFTALNDGLTSAIISFLRTLVFEVSAVMLLPLIFNLDGIWYSIVTAEVMAVIVTSFFVIKKRNDYGY